MSLNARQLAAYQDVIDIYKPIKSAGTSSIGAAKIEAIFELVATDVPCRFFPQSDVSIISPLGRSESGAKAEFETIHCEVTTDIKDMYKIQLKTVNHPLQDLWYTVIGSPEVRPSGGNRRPNYIRASLRGTNPPTISP